MVGARVFPCPECVERAHVSAIVHGAHTCLHVHDVPTCVHVCSRLAAGVRCPFGCACRFFSCSWFVIVHGWYTVGIMVMVIRNTMDGGVSYG